MKSAVIKKIQCPSPEHVDTDPSCALYADGSAYCFGCLTYFSNVADPVKVERVVDDLPERLKYINGLPKETLRGISLPFDNLGYYIVWPDSSYYKRRNWTFDSDRSRYYNPRGHTQPLFILHGDNRQLIAVEGELNALSLRESGLEATVVSPGSAGNFKQNVFRNYLRTHTQYSTILLLVDNDSPGVEACLTAMSYLSGTRSLVIPYLMNNDCNEILITHGKEELKNKIKGLGLS